MVQRLAAEGAFGRIPLLLAVHPEPHMRLQRGDDHIWPGLPGQAAAGDPLLPLTHCSRRGNRASRLRHHQCPVLLGWSLLSEQDLHKVLLYPGAHGGCSCGEEGRQEVQMITLNL